LHYPHAQKTKVAPDVLFIFVNTDQNQCMNGFFQNKPCRICAAANVSPINSGRLLFAVEAQMRMTCLTRLRFAAAHQQ
jgi:hypothetical protein